MSTRPNPSAPPSNPSEAAEPARTRVQIEVSKPVLSLLDHVADVLGAARSQLVTQALVEALPAMVERADAVRKRARELTEAQRGKR